jgi:5'-nucleotidase
VIGSITADHTRDPTPAGESALGDVIADAQWAATADPAVGGAVVALMNRAVSAPISPMRQAGVKAMVT